jgi:hypothetical protein
LSEAGAQFAVDWSVAAGSAQLQRPGQPKQDSSADYYGFQFPIPPRRLEARLAPVSWADLGGDIGWIDGGVDVRFGVPAADGRRFAGNLALGLRSGQPGPFQETKGTHSFWGRLEAYPLLFEEHDDLGVRESHRGVLALGVNGGVFSHQVPLTGASDDPDGVDFDSLQVRRRELRIEAAVGYFLKPRSAAGVLLGLEPYWVAHADAIDVGTYEQSWGVVLVLSGSFFLRAHHAPAPVSAAP